MKCRQVRKILDEYVYGTLSARREGKVRAHLYRCADCEEALESARFVHETMQAWPDVPVPEDGYHRLSSRLEFAPPPAIALRPRRFRHLVAPYVAGLATAASILLLAGSPFTGSRSAELKDRPPVADAPHLLPGESVLKPSDPITVLTPEGLAEIRFDEETWRRLDEETRRRIRDEIGRRARAATVDYETR
jgi:hypothetical protein